MSDDEGEQSQAAAGSPGPDGGGGPVTAPIPGRGLSGPGRPGRAGQVRAVLTGRAAGWVAAAVLAGAVVALSITVATIGSNPVRFAVSVPGPVPLRPTQTWIGAAGPVQRIVISPGGQEVIMVPGGPAGWAVATPDVSGPVMVVPGPMGGLGATSFGDVVTGTVITGSGSTFTISTPGGQKVTVDEQSSTTYLKAGAPASASAVVNGTPVAVLGSLNGSTITATVVSVLPAPVAVKLPA